MFSWQDRPHLYFKYYCLPTALSHNFILCHIQQSSSLDLWTSSAGEESAQFMMIVMFTSAQLLTADNFASEVNADTTLELVTHISTSLPYFSDVFANLIKHDLYFKIFRQYWHFKSTMSIPHSIGRNSQCHRHAASGQQLCHCAPWWSVGYGVSTQRLTGNSKFIKNVSLTDYGLVQSITDLNLLQLSTVPGDHFEVIYDRGWW